jgi:ABC-type cobalt transport system substrate-binding protein
VKKINILLALILMFNFVGFVATADDDLWGAGSDADEVVVEDGTSEEGTDLEPITEPEAESEVEEE